MVYDMETNVVAQVITTPKFAVDINTVMLAAMSLIGTIVITVGGIVLALINSKVNKTKEATDLIHTAVNSGKTASEKQITDLTAEVKSLTSKVEVKDERIRGQQDRLASQPMAAGVIAATVVPVPAPASGPARMSKAAAEMADAASETIEHSEATTESAEKTEELARKHKTP